MGTDNFEKTNSDLQFELVLESIPNAILVINKSGIITFVNRQTETLFGYFKSELIGKSPEILIPERYKATHPHYRNNFFQNKEFRQMGAGRDLFAVKKNDNEFPVEIGLNPIETSKGTQILASIIDITERKKFEEEKNKYTLKIEEQNKELLISEQKLKKLNATKNKLLSIIGHDLGGPLSSFKILIEYLISDFDLTDTKSIKEFLLIMQKSANSTYSLLQNLLDWAKSQQNELIFMPEKINFNELILLIVELYTELCKEKKLSFVYSIPENTEIFGDKNMIMTVLRNLISNAIKFSLEGKKIHIIANKNDNQHIITIKDEGTGIKPENLNKLFKNTEHISTFGTNGEKGSGLGLLLCKDFVEKHGGKIWVESEFGKGSDFKFILPLNNN